MKRNPIFLMVFLAILVTSSSTALQVLRVEASGTIYIRADGSIDPPTAPIYTADNITYTLTGNITADADGIVIERSNVVVDGAFYTVQGTGAGGIGIYWSGIVRMISNVTIGNLTASAFTEGDQARCLIVVLEFRSVL
jgi:hypothetical protein